ncbi:MAG: RecX family transcriptional regulator [Phycisphaerales bacterium]|nr:RecX family transcriptional regulator [Phycisphaerales bacterium]
MSDQHTQRNGRSWSRGRGYTRKSLGGADSAKLDLSAIDKPNPADTRGIITDVLPSGRSDERVAVKVGRMRVATLPRELADELGVLPGVMWDDRLAEQAAQAALFSKSMLYAKRALTSRRLTRSQLLTRLTKRGLSRPWCERIAAEMERIGLIDDAALGDDLAQTIARRKPAGPRYIQAKLRARGLNSKDATASAARATESVDLLEQATQLATRRARSLAKLERAVAQRRLYGVLARRGFDADICIEAVKRALS